MTKIHQDPLAFLEAVDAKRFEFVRLQFLFDCLGDRGHLAAGATTADDEIVRYRCQILNIKQYWRNYFSLQHRIYDQIEQRVRFCGHRYSPFWCM